MRHVGDVNAEDAASAPVLLERERVVVVPCSYRIAREDELFPQVEALACVLEEGTASCGLFLHFARECLWKLVELHYRGNVVQRRLAWLCEAQVFFFFYMFFVLEHREHYIKFTGNRVDAVPAALSTAIFL